MSCSIHRILGVDSLGDIPLLTAVAKLGATFAGAVEKFGFGFFGFNALPPPGEGADPVIVTERAPDGFRGLYIEERFYRVDHIGAHARTTCKPYRYCEAPYDRTQDPSHRRFLPALGGAGLGKGPLVAAGGAAT